MLIRQANLSDLNSIEGLWHTMMVLHSRYNNIYKMKENAVDLYTVYAKSILQDESKKVLVAEENDSILGYIFCETVEQPPVYLETRLGSINEISVDEKYRRHGVGSQLVDECIKWLKENGVKRINIVIALDNPISQGFWKKIGFKSYNETCYLIIN